MFIYNISRCTQTWTPFYIELLSILHMHQKMFSNCIRKVLILQLDTHVHLSDTHMEEIADIYVDKNKSNNSQRNKQR